MKAIARGGRQQHLELWRLAGFEPGRTSPLRIVDLACGCAIKSLTLAQADPMVQITCVDRPEALVVARDLVQRLGVSTQAQFLPQDLHTLDLGQAQYDAACSGRSRSTSLPSRMPRFSDEHGPRWPLAGF